MSDSLRFRQVHLDFHTSEAISGVGKDWDKRHFQDMLRLGNVDSVTVFSKCHHGWSYHPTQVPLSQQHPHLQLDLLGAMIEAAHEVDVKTPVYISVGLDEKLVLTRSEWLIRRADGGGMLQAGYHEFCLRTGYLDYVIAQAEEVVRNYEADGLFLDIVGARNCVCGTCTAELLGRGLDPRDEAARRLLGRETYINYAQRINAAVHAIKPGLRMFHNGGHIIRGDLELARLNTHLELESLPSGGWGYDHFPMSARYAQGLGMEYLGMTGKFHTTWGEFGGFKHPNALRYEGALSLANGARISVGDQMHPFGKLEPATYRLIGEAYAEVRDKEPWCRDVTSVADVGLLSLEAVEPKHASADIAAVDAGAVRVLLQGKILFEVLDGTSDFSRYQVIVLPDAISVQGELQAKLEGYLAGGGRIFATGTSGLDPATGQFALEFGARHGGVSPYKPEYLVPLFPLEHWGNAAFVMYREFQQIEATSGEIMAERQDPFFNRDYLHFCSHQHAPQTGVTAGPAIVRTANTVYLAFEAFQQYFEMGQVVLREIILHGIRQLLPAPTLTTSLPPHGVQTVMRQGDRTIVHLLYAVPIKASATVEVIEDIVPLHDVTVALAAPHQPNRVYLAPQDTDLPWTFSDGLIHTTVPRVECHQMIVVA